VPAPAREKKTPGMPWTIAVICQSCKKGGKCQNVGNLLAGKIGVSGGCHDNTKKDEGRPVISKKKIRQSCHGSPSADVSNVVLFHRFRQRSNKAFTCPPKTTTVAIITASDQSRP
jgi:hypothetical protein